MPHAELRRMLGRPDAVVHVYIGRKAMCTRAPERRATIFVAMSTRPVVSLCTHCSRAIVEASRVHWIREVAKEQADRLQREALQP